MNSSNITYHHSAITRQNRSGLNGHGSIIVWFTGLSGSGKTTLAYLVEERLYEMGCRSFVLDGDNFRHGLSSDLGFSDKDRKENIRRAGEVSKLMMESGVIVLSAFISPFQEDRSFVRGLVLQSDFIEIYCKANIKTCELRDVKGLYRRALSGEIKNYTGIDSHYEEPIDPEIVIDTENKTPEESAEEIINFLKGKGVLSLI